MKKWTSQDIPDMTGKIAIVTGGNSGLGYETVKAFASHGTTVIMACRSLSKGASAKHSIGKVRGEIKLMQLDVSEPSSIRGFAEVFLKEYSRLDILVNNAGVMLQPYALTSLGVESQLSINHLGPFMLTSMLLDVIVKTPGARVVSVSSIAHRKAELNFDDMNYDKGRTYDPMVAYRRSKLANLYFTFELQRLFDANRIDALAVVAHPGVAPTNLMNHHFPRWTQYIIRPLATLFLQRVSVGALGQIRAAVAPDVQGGEFYGPSGKDEKQGYPVSVESTPLSHDVVMAKQLWHFSEEITGCRYLFDKGSMLKS